MSTSIINASDAKYSNVNSTESRDHETGNNGMNESGKKFILWMYEKDSASVINNPFIV